MSVKLVKYVKAVDKFLNCEEELGDALLDASAEIISMTPEKRTVWFHTNIAPLVAKKYRCEHYITNQGGTSFRTDDGRHDTALSKFRYVTQTHIIWGESKQVDVVVSLTRSLKKRRKEGVSYKQALKALNLAYDKQ